MDNKIKTAIDVWVKDGIIYENLKEIGKIYEDGQLKNTDGQFVHIGIELNKI